MKKMIVPIFAALALIGCDEVEAGHVGIKVYLLGREKGVDQEILPPGRYWIGYNEKLYTFPTFTQTKRWTKSKEEDTPANEEFTIQTNDGMQSHADVGVSYRLDSKKIPELFQRYRQRADEITNIVLRTKIRNVIALKATSYSVEDLYGVKKDEFQKSIKAELTHEVETQGIILEDVYFIGAIRPPDNMVNAINEKATAIQKAQKAENEKREAIAEAEKAVVKANGAARVAIAQAEAEAASIKVKAQAEADAIKKKTEALTSTYVEYVKAQQWNGELPQMMLGTGSTPIVDLRGIVGQKPTP